MRIIFYTNDSHLIEMIEGIGHESLFTSHDEEQILEWLDDVPEEDNVFLVIDFDDDQKKREKFSSSLIKNEWIYRFIATSKLSLKDLKKHQKGKSAAHAYLRKPFTAKHLSDAVNEIEMAIYLEENPESDDSGFTPISFGKSNPVKKSLQSLEDLTPEKTEDRDISEFKVSSEVRDLISKHTSNTAHALKNSEINKKIQAKFDFIFGEGASASVSVDAKGEMDLPEWQENTEPGKKPINLNDDSITLDEEEDGLSIDFSESEEAPEEEIDIDLSESHHLEEEGEISLDDDEELIIDEPEVEASDEIEVEEINEESLQFGEEDEEIEELEAQSEESPALQEQDDLEMQIPSDDDLELPNIQQNNAPSKEVDMSVSKGKTGELTIEEESDSEDVGLEFGSSAPDDSETEDNEGGLEFGTDEESEDLDLGNDNESIEEGIDLGGIELGDDEGQGLELGDDGDQGLDLGDDSDQGLELGASDESSELEIGDDSTGLDLSEESSDELVLGEEEESKAELETAAEDDMGIDLGDDSADEGTEEELILGADEESDEEQVLSEKDVDITADDFDEGSGELNLSEIEASSEEDIHNDNTGSFEDDDLFGSDDDHTDKTIVMQKGSLSAAPEDSEDEIDLSSEEDIIDEKTGEFDDLDVDTISDESDVTMIMSGQQLASETQTEELIDDEDEEITPPPAKKAPSPKEKGVMSFSNQIDVAATYVNEGDLVRLQATIRQLREDREKMLSEIKVLKGENSQLDQENLSLRAELDDAKVEVTISKKRHADEVDELKYRLKISDEKRLMAEEKYRQAHKEIDRLEGRVRLDINQVKHREKELEAKLELVTMDSESQVKTRDMKILELKRKIDQLEFNMENVVIREQKSREDKIKLEERLQRMMKTLRGSIQLLEDDMTVEANRLAKNNDLKD